MRGREAVEPDEVTRGAGRTLTRPAPPAQAVPGGRATSLPTDVVADAAGRVRVLAWIYAGTFFVVGPLLALLSPAQRGIYLETPLLGLPAVVSILGAVAIALGIHRAHLAPARVLTLGLVFDVIGAYGIAASRYLSPQADTGGPAAVSWVAVWILVFATIVPSPPRRAFVAALLAATAVPVMTAVGLLLAGTPLATTAGTVLRTLVPYLVVAVLAAVVARVVYRLGTEITHARELGAYHLVERLGAGGMGEVWRAEHRLLARPAAIKLIRADPGGPSPDAEARARFEQEARVTATLRSPHTVQIYDFGVAEDGAFYYVMELLEGCDLHTLVERFGPVPVNRAVALLTQVCHSLGEAHARGIVHRDIKPSNVFVCRYGRDVDFVKVLDFGLVKAVGKDEAETRQALTAEAVTRGTPGFMSPEQAVADPTIDARADLYALGCLAFWLVTGKPVFAGTSPIDTIVKHVSAAPPPPSTAAAQAIPPAFDALVLACLAKDRQARPASADDVAARLDAVAPDARWSPARARAWWEAHVPTRAAGPANPERSSAVERLSD
ncbi:MAG: serine/threonine-protein kinase [Vicinamibacterales bacterium]